MQEIRFDRIVARLGAATASDLLSACGLDVGKETEAFPLVSESYQSLQVPGLFVVGAAGGAPLIKECLDQGYRAVEAILGNEIPCADEKLIQDKILDVGETLSPAELVQLVQAGPSLFAFLAPASLYRVLAQARLRRFKPGETIIAPNEYVTVLHLVLDGEVALHFGVSEREKTLLGPGRFCGEMQVMSGRPCRGLVTATCPSLLLEVKREEVLRLARAVPEIRSVLERTVIMRTIQTGFAPGIGEALLSDIVASAHVVPFHRNTVLIEPNTAEAPVYLLTKGAVTLSRRIDGSEVIVDYLSAGDWVGGNTAINGAPSSVRIRAAIDVEAIKLDHGTVCDLLEQVPEMRVELTRLSDTRRLREPNSRRSLRSRQQVDFLLREATPLATDILIIDQTLCIGCDNCEKACAETHGGTSRLDRQSGPAFAHMHLPGACRHCDDAPCSRACPANAIRRAPSGETYIDEAICVGCGDCEQACPYDAISMAAPAPTKPGLLTWLLFGCGPGPGGDKSMERIAQRSGRKMPVKCDLCRDLDSGPVCVRACPTGAAFRTTPEALLNSLLNGSPR